jgi:SHS2 domain-containing protein
MFGTFEHTADLGLRIRADDLDTLFAEAGQALFSVIVDNPQDIRAVEEMPCTIKGSDAEELLHDWLTELLFTFHVRRLLLAKFQVRITSTELTAIAIGEKFDPSRHQLGMEVKAITWHGLKVVQTPSGWMAEVIVDI